MRNGSYPRRSGRCLPRRRVVASVWRVGTLPSAEADDAAEWRRSTTGRGRIGRRASRGGEMPSVLQADRHVARRTLSDWARRRVGWRGRSQIAVGLRRGRKPDLSVYLMGGKPGMGARARGTPSGRRVIAASARRRAVDKLGDHCSGAHPLLPDPRSAAAQPGGRAGAERPLQCRAERRRRPSPHPRLPACDGPRRAVGRSTGARGGAPPPAASEPCVARREIDDDEPCSVPPQNRPSVVAMQIAHRFGRRGCVTVTRTRIPPQRRRAFVRAVVTWWPARSAAGSLLRCG
jgi:hypothetical protein